MRLLIGGKFDDAKALGVIGLGDRVLQDAAAVAHPLAAAGLRGVQVAQGDVIKAVEARRVDLPAAADPQEPLAVAGVATGNKGVGDHDHDLGRFGVALQMAQAARHGGVVVVHGLIEDVTDERRIGEGDAVEAEGAAGGRNAAAGDGIGDRSDEVQAAFAQEPRVGAHPDGVVVVAGDDHDREFEFTGEPFGDVVEQLHRFRRGHPTIVNVAGDDHGVELRHARDIDELIQHVRLIVGQTVAFHQAAQVPVGGVKKSHRALSLRVPATPDASPASVPYKRQEPAGGNAGSYRLRRFFGG